MFSYRGDKNIRKTKVFSYRGHKNLRKTKVFSYRGYKNLRKTYVFSYRGYNSYVSLKEIVITPMLSPPKGGPRGGSAPPRTPIPLCQVNIVPPCI